MKKMGFTIIELMIVLVIVGILAVIAIPAYQNYIVKSRVSEGLNMASPAELAVEEYTTIHNTLPSSQADTLYDSPQPTANVASIVVGNTGEITITYTAPAGNGTIILKPVLQANGDITWDCSGGSLNPSYRPSSCR
jgi:type IV pilus assembly protein PilA